MKSLKLILFILLLLCNNKSNSQSNYQNILINAVANDKIDIVNDMCFVNMNTGFITATYYKGSNSSDGYVFRTTNGGISWDNKLKSPFSGAGPKMAISFSNANSGYLIVKNVSDRYWKTSNAGESFYQVITSSNLPYNDLHPVISANSNGELLLIRKGTNNVCRIPNTGTGFNTYNFSTDIELSHIEISKSSNIIYICGKNKNTLKPYFVKSTDGGSTYVTILDFDGLHDTYNTGNLFHMSIINSEGYDIIKISSEQKLIEYNENLNSINYLTTSNWGNERKISFGDMNNGYYMIKDFGSDDPFQSNGLPQMFRTTDNGQTWISDYFPPSNNDVLSYVNRFYTFGQITYFTYSFTSDYQAYFLLRTLNENFITYVDNISSSGIITMNGVDHPTPSPTGYMRGGYFTASSDPDTDDKILYKWGNGIMRKYFDSENPYNLLWEGTVSTHYKTKNLSTTKDAISNISTHTSPPLRVIRDTTLPGYPTIIHQIQESIDGGIFYSRSTNDGSNFSKEEIVNFRVNNNTESSDNKNSFLNIKYAGGRPLTLSEKEKNVSAVWERNNAGKTEICVSQRVLNTPQTGYEWDRYTNPKSYIPIFTSFNSPSNFNSYPKIFVVAPVISDPITWSYQYIYVPHLEPGTIGNDLHVKAKYSTDSSDFIIGYNVSDVAVTASNNSFGFIFHFAYKIDGHIKYKKVSINYENSNFNLIKYDSAFVSLDDGQQSRFAPDISLRNGRPVIAWQGSSLRTRTIVYENGNEDIIVNNYFPILAKYKYSNSTNGGESWSTLINYNSPPNITQQNANVEGCKNKPAFLINYSVDNRIFRQDVKFQNPIYSNYVCCPNTFEGIDAKLVRGSFIDDFGQNSNPMLLTLQQQSPTLYGVNKQPFSITNTPCNAADNYTNLEGILRDRNINYSFNLGPIIVKNTVVSPNARLSSPTDIIVQNIVDFSENMISKPFYLSNGDTLILAGTGNYILYPNGTFANKKFNVSLFKNSTNEIQQLLFRDTIKIEDSIQSEYLRGFIINNIHGGSDSFYVKIIIDSSNISDAAYSYCGVYSPDEVSGDNFTNYKSKVHFENQSYQNISNIPITFELNQNYPNPFNPSTTIKYALPKNEFVTIKIYDIVGREIIQLVNEYKQAGYHTVNFNGVNMASGVYFYRIQAGDFVSVKRMLMIK